MNAEILAVGHELLMGEIVDTNSSYIAQRLAGTGITVRWMSHVGDDIENLSDAFKRALGRSGITISTGGLGPTSDDLTREAVAAAVGEEMAVDPATLEWLKGVFARRGMAMPPTNVKQATLIPSATSVPNPNGTAPGWWVEKDGRHVVLLPGPPREIRQIWDETVAPRLAALAGAGAIATRTLKTYGLSEGGMDEILADLFGRENPYLGIYAHTDGIHLRMIGRGPDRDTAARAIEPVEAEIRSRLGEVIWGEDDDTPAGRAARMLIDRRHTLAVLEGASGGALASMLHAQPDGGAFFRGALVPGAGPVHPGHRPAPVDPEGALVLARLARQSLDADIGLAVTPMAAGNGAVEAGSVFIGMASAGGAHVATGRLPRRNAEWMMQRSATMAVVELLSALSADRL